MSKKRITFVVALVIAGLGAAGYSVSPELKALADQVLLALGVM